MTKKLVILGFHETNKKNLFMVSKKNHCKFA